MQTTTKYSTPFSPYYVIQPTAKHTATVFIFHGIGDTGDSWYSVFQKYVLPLQTNNELSHIRFVSFTAPTIRVTSFNAEVPALFNVISMKRSVSEQESIDQESLNVAAKNVHSLIEQEMKSSSIPSDRIMLVGFSQGGSTALFSGISCEHQLAGIVGLSSRLRGAQVLQQKFSTTVNAQKTPLLLCHGTGDNVIPFEEAPKTVEFFETMRKEQKEKNVEFKVYKGMPHTTCSQEMMDLKNFIAQKLA